MCQCQVCLYLQPLVRTSDGDADDYGLMVMIVVW